MAIKSQHDLRIEDRDAVAHSPEDILAMFGQPA
jgi:hypothetical protein